MRELLTRPVTELAELVRSGEVSSRELVGASLEAIERLDPEINAFTAVSPERALAAADAVKPGDERPFAGVPIAIKDLAVTIEGWRLTNGSDLFGEYTATHDSFVVRRFKEAGFVIVGTTSTPEFGILCVTEPRRFGPTRNPWSTDHVPGGSSGGSAAAVAAGMVPIAHGSDGAGSIRIPAACCGLVGLKVARGRISHGPTMGEALLNVDGTLTRTVEDTARVLDVLHGYEPGDTNWAPPPAEPFAAAAAREPGKLRIGLTLKPAVFTEVGLDPAGERAVRDAGELLASLGHEVEEVDPPWGETGMLDVFLDLWASVTAPGVAFGGLIAGRDPRPEDVESLSWWLYERALGLDSVRQFVQLTGIQAVMRAYVSFFLERDALLMPTIATRPPRIGHIDGDGPDPAAELDKAVEVAPYTALWNLTGQPAISLPLYEGEDGLPLAVQIAGPPANEALLLSLATQLEAAHPWHPRIPALVGG